MFSIFIKDKVNVGETLKYKGSLVQVLSITSYPMFRYVDGPELYRASVKVISQT